MAAHHYSPIATLYRGHEIMTIGSNIDGTITSKWTIRSEVRAADASAAVVEEGRVEGPFDSMEKAEAAALDAARAAVDQRVGT